MLDVKNNAEPLFTIIQGLIPDHIETAQLCLSFATTFGEDLFYQIMIGDQGNGRIEAFWEVQEMLSDDTRSWDVIGDGTIVDFDTSIINPPYRVKLSYDGDKTFSFIVNDIYTVSYDAGPDKRRVSVTSWKDISAGINATDGSNNGYVYGKIDNVYINDNNTVYDDFSSPCLTEPAFK